MAEIGLTETFSSQRHSGITGIVTQIQAFCRAVLHSVRKK